MIAALNEDERESVLDAAVKAGATSAGYVLRRLPLEIKDLCREWLEEKAPNFWKWAQKVAAHPSVTKIFDEEKIIAGTRERIARAQAAASK